MKINHSCINYGYPESGCPADGDCRNCRYYGPTTVSFSNGVEIINVTPHDLTFEDDGKVVSVPTSGIVINAKAKEAIVKDGTPTIVKISFEASNKDKKKLERIEQMFPGIIPVGSIIAAQAFPGRVFGMTPMRFLKKPLSLKNPNQNPKKRSTQLILNQRLQQLVFMRALTGFERVHPSEKRMNPSKFTTF